MAATSCTLEVAAQRAKLECRLSMKSEEASRWALPVTRRHSRALRHLFVCCRIFVLRTTIISASARVTCLITRQSLRACHIYPHPRPARCPACPPPRHLRSSPLQFRAPCRRSHHRLRPRSSQSPRRPRCHRSRHRLRPRSFQPPCRPRCRRSHHRLRPRSLQSPCRPRCRRSHHRPHQLLCRQQLTPPPRPRRARPSPRRGSCRPPCRARRQAARRRECRLRARAARSRRQSRRRARRAHPSSPSRS